MTLGAITSQVGQVVELQTAGAEILRNDCLGFHSRVELEIHYHQRTLKS